MGNVSIAPKLVAADYSDDVTFCELSTNVFLAASGFGAKSARPEIITLVDLSDTVLDEYNKNVVNDLKSLLYWDGTSAATALKRILDIRPITGGHLAVIVVNGKAFIYKSVDNCVSFGDNAPSYNNGRPVLRVGYYAWDGVTEANRHSELIATLNSRGLCETAAGDIFLAEYNTNDTTNIYSNLAFTPAPGDQSIIYKSSDGGDTWSIWWELNTAPMLANTATQRIRHWHCISYHQGADKLMIGLGDGQNNSAYLVVDPTITPTNNLSIHDYPGMPGIAGRVGVSDRIFNATDFIEIPGSDWVIHVTDGSSDGAYAGFEKGLQRFRISNPTTIENVYTMTLSGRIFSFGARMSDGTLIAVEFADPLVTHNDYNAYLYTSHNQGKDWKRVATIHTRDFAGSSSPVTPVGLWVDSSDRLHYSVAAMGSKSAESSVCTAIIKRQGWHYDPDLITPVHPAYFVGSGGVNSVSDTQNVWVPDESSNIAAPELGNLLGITDFRILSRNVTWASATSIIWSQAASTTTLREFALLKNTGAIQIFLGGQVTTIMSSGAVTTEFGSGTIVVRKLELRLNFVTGAYRLIANNKTVASGTVTVGAARNPGTLFMIGARAFDGGVGTTTGNTFMGVDDRVGDTEIWIAGSLFRRWLMPATGTSVTESVASSTGTLYGGDGTDWTTVVVPSRRGYSTARPYAGLEYVLETANTKQPACAIMLASGFNDAPTSTIVDDGANATFTESPTADKIFIIGDGTQTITASGSSYYTYVNNSETLVHENYSLVVSTAMPYPFAADTSTFVGDTYLYDMQVVPSNTNAIQLLRSYAGERCYRSRLEVLSTGQIVVQAEGSTARKVVVHNCELIGGGRNRFGENGDLEAIQCTIKGMSLEAVWINSTYAGAGPTIQNCLLDRDGLAEYQLITFSGTTVGKWANIKNNAFAEYQPLETALVVSDQYPPQPPADADHNGANPKNLPIIPGAEADINGNVRKYAAYAGAIQIDGFAAPGVSFPVAGQALGEIGVPVLGANGWETSQYPDNTGRTPVLGANGWEVPAL